MPRAPLFSPSRWLTERTVLLGLVGLLVLGLAGLATATGWTETWAQLTELSLTQLSVLLVLSLVNYLARGLRWHLLVRRLGVPTGLWDNMRHFLAGFAMTVTPGRVGELVRLRWIRRETGWAVERTLPLMLADRAADLAAMAVLLGVTLAVSTTGVAGAVPVAILALVVAWAATRPGLFSACATFGYRVTGRMPRLFARLRSGSRDLMRFNAPSVLSVSLGLGLFGWLAEGYGFWLLLGWMGADIALATAVLIFVFSTLAGGLTGAPGGLGGAEAAMIALLTLEAVPLDTAVAATVVIRVTTLWFAIGIGLALFPAAERIANRRRHALE